MILSRAAVARQTARMRVALVLAGGGAAGAFEAGVIDAVEAHALAPTILSGTSAGALNAAGLAHGLSSSDLAALWRRTGSRDVYRLRRDVWRLPRPRGLLTGGGVGDRLLNAVGWSHLFSTSPLRRTLVEALGGEHVDVTPGQPLAVSSVEVGSGELVRFVSELPRPQRRGQRYREVAVGVDHLMASAAIPLVFPPASVNDTAFWDAGLVANTPLAPALAYEPDLTIVVTTATRPRPAPGPASPGQALSLLIDNVLANSLADDLARARELNRLLGEEGGPDAKRPVDLVVIEPIGEDLGDSLDFSAEAAEHRLAVGRRLGRQALSQRFG